MYKMTDNERATLCKGMMDLLDEYDYEYTATERSIDSGRMSVTEIDSSVLSELNNIEVVRDYG